jgi:hypothetical protein
LDSNGAIINEVPFLNLYAFNTIYDDVDIQSTASNIALPYFKYPFLYNSSLLDRILIETIEL